MFFPSGAMGLQEQHCSAKTSFTSSLKQWFQIFDLSCNTKLSLGPFAASMKTVKATEKHTSSGCAKSATTLFLHNYGKKAQASGKQWEEKSAKLIMLRVCSSSKQPFMQETTGRKTMVKQKQYLKGYGIHHFALKKYCWADSPEKSGVGVRGFNLMVIKVN